MHGASRIAWIFAGVALCGCARLDTALDFASLSKRPGRSAVTVAESPMPTETPQAELAAAPAIEAAGPQLLPPIEATAHEAAKPPSWSIFDILTPARAIGESEEAAAPPSEFTTVADVQVSPAAAPTKEELLATLKSRQDVDTAEYDRWEKIVQSTPENDWPLVAIQLQAVLNYKSFQASQTQAPPPTEAPPAGNSTSPPPETAAASPQAAPSAEASAVTSQSPAAPVAPETSPSEPAAAAGASSTPSATAPATAPTTTVATNIAGEVQPDVLPPPAAEKPPQPIAPDTPAPSASTTAGTWREHLERAIETLEAELSSIPDEPAQVVANATPASEEEYQTQTERRRDRARKEAFLRLLYLAAMRPAEAARGVEEFSSAEQEFWKHQLHGLGVFLDDEGAPVADRRTRLALRELQDGLHHLAAASGLDVRNLAFCPQVYSFGNFVEFTPAEFHPGQEVLLYAEVDNFTVDSQPSGYETELQGSYQIFDAGGRRIAEHTFPPEKEVCRNRRRDYFIPFRMYLPKRIDPGPYSLQLTVEDLKGRKFGQSSIRFAIVP
jgi:hypothetical protein